MKVNNNTEESQSRQTYSVGVKNMKRKYKLNETIFERVTPDVCYWVGFLYGDGSCTNENKVRLSLGYEDYQQLIRFRNFIGSDDKPIKVWERDGHQYCTFETRSWRIHNSITKYQLTRIKKNRTRLHIDLFNKDFIRGLFDADGSFYYDGRNKDALFTEITGYKPVLKDVKNILVSAGVISNKKNIVKNGCIFRIRMAKEDTLNFIKYIYGDSPRYFLSRKYAMAMNYLERLSDATSKDETTVHKKYIKPMSEYNVGKRQEHADRQLFRRYEDETNIED